MAEILKHQIPNPKIAAANPSDVGYQETPNLEVQTATTRISRDVVQRSLCQTSIYATTASAIHDVQRAFLDVERGFSDSFA
jgi:hypothetical protein